ncbi:hypothetical protein HF263_35480 [Rhizobium leguminosarum]|uniref:hypothetical protein n=1 Tax=Rhizobium leguminosarum TaxID=384 RepID=UPI001C916221|nr:hypothetical protein [Rhizobium leguminosarum]MBY2997019.1 hypothetical protein [Rhizobium leguminosarum]MBY3061274.1 hypothetical protein [Rhizobium leguminosarum]
MTQAKHMYGREKTDATRESFRRKLVHMYGILQTWKKQGYRDKQFWPSSLGEFAVWQDPDRGIFSWSSPNVTSRSNPRYEKLVKRYWRLQEKAAPHLADHPDDTREKRIILKLAEENARLLWANMELRAALVRAAPDNEVLTRISFP